MRLPLRSRITLLTAAIMLATGAANSLFSALVVGREYGRALEGKAVAIGKTLRAQLDRILALGIGLEELVGFDQQSRDTVAENPELSGVLVSNPAGSILFADDPSRLGGAVRPPRRTTAEGWTVALADGPDGLAAFIPLQRRGELIGWVIVEYRRDFVRWSVSRIQLASGVVTTGFSAAALLLLGLIVSIWVHRPLEALARSVRELRAKGPGETTLAQVRTRDEMGDLARAFNDLVQSLRETTVSKDYMNNVVGSLGEALLVTDPQGTITMVNPRACQLTGRGRAELEGTSLARLVPGLPGLVTDGAWANTDTNLLAREGTNVPILLGRSPLRDSRGLTTSYVFTATDIREHRKAEEEKEALQRALRHSEKLEAIGTLAGGIAHDFNNILMAVLGYTELMLLSTQDNAAMTANLNEVRKAGLRARDLVEQIMTFSRQREEERRPIQAGPVVGEATRLLRATLPTTIDIRCEIRHELPNILADPSSIHRIVMNLCTNAAHAMEDGGSLVVALDRFDPSGEWVRLHPVLEGGPYVHLRVSDTGCGMGPDVLERIFEPYYTTKPPGKGTGMGLAVVHGIVSSSGGHVTVDSIVGKGSHFDVYFPAIETETVRTSEPAAAAAGGSERLLIVDDESAIVEMERLLLERAGYRVTTRTSSPEALKLFRSTPDDFDLVVTDMTMPQLRGDHLAQAILGIRPRVPVILCTGFSEQLTEERARALGARALLMKPVLARDLLTAIRGVLDRGDRRG
jgi:PAS domain S-box-containing protein